MSRLPPDIGYMAADIAVEKVILDLSDAMNCDREWKPLPQ